MIRQARAIKSIDLIAFASISLAPSNLDEDSKAPAGRPVDDVVGHPISGRPCGSTEGVVGFPLTPHSPPTDKNSCHNTRRAAAIPMVGGSWFHKQESPKRSMLQPHVMILRAGLEPQDPGTTSTK